MPTGRRQAGRRSSGRTVLILLAVLLTLTPIASAQSWVPIGQGRFGNGAQEVVTRRGEPAEVYVADDSLGFFYSGDRGASFEQRNTGFSSTSLLALVADPNTPGLLYAGISGIAGATGGVYRSTNNGLQWEVHSNGLGNRNVTALAIDPGAGYLLYAGTPTGVYRSVDGGENWEVAGLTGVRIECLAVNPRLPDEVLAGTSSHGVWRSINQGRTWTRVNEGLPTMRILDIVIRDQATPTAFIGTEEGVYRRAAYLAGSAWTAINSGLPTGSDVYGLLIDPLRPDTIYATVNRTPLPVQQPVVYTSANNGNDWQPFVITGLTNTRATSIAFSSADRKTFYLASFGGDVYRLTLEQEPRITPTPRDADIDGDGDVDAEDLILWQQTWDGE